MTLEESTDGRQFLDAMRSLPLMGTLFLHMQAMNLALIDDFLRDAEEGLLAEYIEIEKTPIQSAMFVSALSQMWIFALYELLRTWRQWVRDLLRYAEELADASARGDSERAEREREQARILEEATERQFVKDSEYISSFESAAEDQDFVQQLREADDRVLPIFRRIEALRVTLAKHEIPKLGGARAQAPGYGRISTENGSMYWFVVDREGSSEAISRRFLADLCCSLARNHVS